MNRGDMEGLLSHYHPNCGDGAREKGRANRFDRRHRGSGSGAERRSIIVIILYEKATGHYRRP